MFCQGSWAGGEAEPFWWLQQVLALLQKVSEQCCGQGALAARVVTRDCVTALPARAQTTREGMVTVPL